MKRIKGENYNVTIDIENKKIIIDGTLRLRGLEGYHKISDALDSLLRDPEHTTVNITQLEFLNSSGIAMFSRFVIRARKVEHLKLLIIASNSINWQGRSLNNLQRLMPNLELVFE